MARITEGDCYAAFYDRDPVRELPFLQRLTRAYELPERLRVLDVGCGTGRLLRPLASLGWDVVGMEPHPHYVAMSRTVASDLPGKIDVVAGGFGDLEGVGEFDLVVAIGDPWWYLLTVDERADALARAHSSLRPGGVIFLDGPNLDWILEHYRTPTPSEVRHQGVLIRRSPRHEIDRQGRVWTHVDTFTVAETGEEVSTVHRFAIVSIEEITTALASVGFDDVRTYPSWAALSPAPPEGSRILVAARRPSPCGPDTDSPWP
ncbi:MAG: class I SAM-dependent methyltransferase [Actinomycetota bacterium]|nr:class I SAM-dependent methyltransferase [Actinomycetota bacterium]